MRETIMSFYIDLYLTNDVPWLNMHSTRTWFASYIYNFKGRMRVRYVNDALNVNRGLPMECWWYWWHRISWGYIQYKSCAYGLSSLIKQTHFLFNTIASIYFATYQTFHHVHTLHMQLFHPKVYVCSTIVFYSIYTHISGKSDNRC